FYFIAGYKVARCCSLGWFYSNENVCAMGIFFYPKTVFVVLSRQALQPKCAVTQRALCKGGKRVDERG
ncbi:MAG: hypothetical protein ACRC1V_04330, partial [Plesiomonas sp.]